MASSEEAPILEDHERKDAVFLEINESFPGARKVTKDPPIYEVPNFLSKDEIDRLLAAGLPGLKRSIVVDADAGKSPAPSRTSESCYLDKTAFGWLHEKVALLTNKPVPTHEPPQIARYEHSQFYLPHFDAFDATSASGRECIATGGQRVATVLIYLNTLPPECGGETSFPRLGRKFSPKQGTAIVFFPCTVDGKLDPFALHAAESVKADAASPSSSPGSEIKKFVAQVWVRQHAYERAS